MQKLNQNPNTRKIKKESSLFDKEKKIFNHKRSYTNINFSSANLPDQSKLISNPNTNLTSETKFPFSWEFIS